MEAMSVARTFNSPLEAGLRCLFILHASGRTALDTQRLLYFDYLAVHSEDAGGPPSLHPTTPSQTGEVLVRRDLINRGLALLHSRELVDRKYLASGIRYQASRAGHHVATHFESPYALQLLERARWVVSTFGTYSEPQLDQFVKRHMSQWSGELVQVREAGDVGGNAHA